jgi:2-amino-4-hydroxy-6-hydroxymethyldihydropteridine diphosphokinase
MKEEVYLLLGSNEGSRHANLLKATDQIALSCGRVIRQSSLYETEAWGMKDQSNFLNQALRIETNLTPLELLSALKNIEKQTGRTETVKWGPRVIDIDILFYGKAIVDLPTLKIPHPYLHERRFTLAPLKEIAAEFIHPLQKKSVTMLLESCPDNSEVVKLG